jgi:hypothetical protein
MGMLYIGIHHTCVCLQEYITLIMQAAGHILVNGFEKCFQAIISFVRLIVK